MKLDVKTPTGADAGTRRPARRAVRHRAQHRGHAPGRHRAARRRPSGTHSTKTRAEVRGGGAKPWRQKGTGRARQGSIRAPHWRGGGVAHGPKPRDYRQRTPKKMIRLALRSALSDRAAEGKVLVVDDWGIDDAPHQGGDRAARARSACAPRASATTRVLARARPHRGRGVEVVPQPRRAGADRAPRGAQHLRRARQRLARVQQGHARGRGRALRRRATDDASRPTTPSAETRRWRVSNKNPRDIIIRPVVSEKSYAAFDAQRLHVRRRRATPTRSRSATRSRRSSTCKVTNVNTLNRKGKRKRNRRTGGCGTRARLEAGHRLPRRGRPHRDLRELTMPIRKRKPTSPGSPVPDRLRLRRDHQRQAREVAHQAEAAAPVVATPTAA